MFNKLGNLYCFNQQIFSFTLISSSLLHFLSLLNIFCKDVSSAFTCNSTPLLYQNKTSNLISKWLQVSIQVLLSATLSYTQYELHISFLIGNWLSILSSSWLNFSSAISKLLLSPIRNFKNFNLVFPYFLMTFHFSVDILLPLF